MHILMAHVRAKVLFAFDILVLEAGQLVRWMSDIG